MEKKLSDVLHMYLGCEVFIKKPKTRKPKIWTLVGVDNTFENPVRCSNGEYLCACSFNDVKPLLRPLSDMTEEEYDLWDNGIDGGLVQGTTDMIEQEAKKTLYLLKREFDLFGWIEAGLAIDKTKQLLQ